MENKITLKMVSEEVGILKRNNQDLICPLVPPMTVRQRATTALGQVQEQVHIQKSPCNTNCPMFRINSIENFEGGEKKVSATICCGGTPVDYNIVVEETPKGDENKVIKLQ